jgi:hypothetical protein
MASQARYPNLPGFEFVTQDGQMIPVRDRPLTESILIIGPALDGPTDRILQVNNLSDLEFIYGKMSFDSVYLGPTGQNSGYSGNALVKAIREVSAGGCGDIRSLRVGGTVASGTTSISATLNAGVTGSIQATAKFGGRLYNQMSLVFTSGATSGQLVVNIPTVKGPSLTFKYLLTTSGTTVSQLIDAVNGNNRNFVVTLALPSAGGISPTAAARLLNGTIQLAGGTDGTIFDDMSTSKASYYNALVNGVGSTPALFSDFLADYEVDIVYLADIYADDVVVAGNFTTSVATDFSNFLARRTIDHPMIGVIGCRPLNDFSSRAAIQAHVDALTNTQSGQRGVAADNYMNMGYFLNNGFSFNDGTLDGPLDAGAYLQVVAADVLYNDVNIGVYQESAAGAYAGTLSKLNPQIPATYKPVAGIFSIPYEFTRAQLDLLNGGIAADLTQGLDGGGAYVTLRRIINRGTLFVRDVTTARRTSDFKDLQPLRIANSVHKGIKDIVFPYLGMPNSIPNRSAMEAQIKSFLDQMADAGALQGRDGVGYTVQIRADNPLARMLGIIDIEITLRPALQIKTIRVKIKMSL